MAGDSSETRKRKKEDSNGSKHEPSSRKNREKQDDPQFTTNQLLIMTSLGLVVVSMTLRLAWMHVMQETANVKFIDEEGSYPPNISYSAKKWGSFRLVS